MSDFDTRAPNASCALFFERFHCECALEDIFRCETSNLVLYGGGGEILFHVHVISYLYNAAVFKMGRSQIANMVLFF